MHAWDDAYDGDPADHEPAYRRALISLPGNPLYQPCMVPFLIKQLYIDWMCANEYEANKEQEHLHKAYMLRAGFFRIMTTLVPYAGRNRSRTGKSTTNMALLW